jgi:hypothetical protein
MQPQLDEMAVLRQEIVNLLCQQMKDLDSPFQLTDAQLKECYSRQVRVQELRERLQAASDRQNQANDSDRSVHGVPQERDEIVPVTAQHSLA